MEDYIDFFRKIHSNTNEMHVDDILKNVARIAIFTVNSITYI